MDLTEKLNHSLPGSFEFYHLGSVEPAAPTAQELPGPFEITDLAPDSLAIAFQMQGDVKGLILALFATAEDESSYMEMGNILASQLVSRLSSEHGLDVMISPPRVLAHERLGQIAKAGGILARQQYVHQNAGTHVPVRLMILDAGTMEGAHA